MVTHSFNVEAFRLDGSRIGWVNDFEWLNVTLRHNRRDTATLSVKTDHRHMASLVEPGARFVITCNHDAPGATPSVFSGMVNGFRKPDDQDRIECYLLGDWGILDVLGWPIPGAAIDQQTQTYYTATGPGETVIRDLVVANMTRLGIPISAPTSQGRGTEVTSRMRFYKLGEEIERLSDRAGIGVRVTWQPSAGYALEFYEPTDRRARVLSELNGTLTGWSWQTDWPTTTRVVVGGAGEGVDRVLGAQVNAEEEATWGVIREEFVDATSAQSTSELSAAAAEALTAGAAQSGFSLSVSQGSVLTYGKNLFVGDQVRVETLPGLYVDDTVREVHLTMSTDEGPKVTPMVGWSGQHSMAIVAAALSRMAGALRALRAT